MFVMVFVMSFRFSSFGINCLCANADRSIAVIERGTCVIVLIVVWAAIVSFRVMSFEWNVQWGVFTVLFVFDRSLFVRVLYFLYNL